MKTKTEQEICLQKDGYKPRERYTLGANCECGHWFKIHNEIGKCRKCECNKFKYIVKKATKVKTKTKQEIEKEIVEIGKEDGVFYIVYNDGEMLKTNGDLTDETEKVIRHLQASVMMNWDRIKIAKKEAEQKQQVFIKNLQEFIISRAKCVQLNKNNSRMNWKQTPIAELGNIAEFIDKLAKKHFGGEE